MILASLQMVWIGGLVKEGVPIAVYKSQVLSPSHQSKPKDFLTIGGHG